MANAPAKTKKPTTRKAAPARRVVTAKDLDELRELLAEQASHIAELEAALSSQQRPARGIRRLRPRKATAMPGRVPGKTVQIVAMYDADHDAEDLWLLQENGSTWHMWYRAHVGWSGPEHLANPS